jgi:hypothetical protein
VQLLRTVWRVGAFVVTSASIASAQRAVVPFGGTVVDSLRQPLSNAEVSLPALNLSKTTNDKGVFTISEVPAGVHRVVVKHIGYGQLDTTLAFPADSAVQWRVTLGRVVTLDSVLVTAPLEPWVADFEANRARGFGRFLTSADLAKFGAAALPAAVRGLGGVAITRTMVGQSYMSSPRGPMTRCPPINTRLQDPAAAAAAQEAVDDCLRRERLYYVPDPIEAKQGLKRSCYPLVYIDQTLMTTGIPTPPFDIGAYAADQIEALEWYESPSSTPAKYSARQAQCGVLALYLKKKKR